MHLYSKKAKIKSAISKHNNYVVLCSVHCTTLYSPSIKSLVEILSQYNFRYKRNLGRTHEVKCKEQTF